MKAEEQYSDRKAEVYFHVMGQVKPVKEYEGDRDPEDGAIFCSVPVNAKDEIRISGKTSGTTLSSAYDIKIDGFLRKAKQVVGKAVSRNHMKINCDKFLYYKDSKVFETTAVIEAAPELKPIRKNQPEIFGTIEVRIFMLRKFSDEWPIGDCPTYYDYVCNNLPAHSHDEADPPIPTFQTVPQDVKVKFHEDSPALDKNAENRQKRAIRRNRPGKMPWATFRFHLRSEEAIEKHKLEVTFDTNDKKAEETHILSFERVAPLQLGTKPPEKASSTTPAPASTTVDQQVTMSRGLSVIAPKPAEQVQNQDIGETTCDSVTTIEDNGRTGTQAALYPLKQPTPLMIVTHPPMADQPVPSPSQNLSESRVVDALLDPTLTTQIPSPPPSSKSTTYLGPKTSLKRTPNIADLIKDLHNVKKKYKGVQAERSRIAPALQPFKANEEEERKKLLAEIQEINQLTEMETKALEDDRRTLEYFMSVANGGAEMEE